MLAARRRPVVELEAAPNAEARAEGPPAAEFMLLRLTMPGEPEPEPKLEPFGREADGAALPFDPGLPPPPLPRRVRMAWAPKLIRRVNGVVGAVRPPLPGPSSSSMAFSSMESELVDMLPRRNADMAEVLVGEVPDNPRVETESLRRWASVLVFMVAEGKTGVPATVLPRWRREAMATWVMEARRSRGTLFWLGPSPDIVEDRSVKVGAVQVRPLW